MIALSRRRPGSITLFAVLFFASSLIVFVERMFNLADEAAMLQRLFPAIDWSRDVTIVWFSAWLSIALIPIGMVWLSAVRFARWLVTLMAGAKVLLLVPTVASKPELLGLLGPVWLVSTLLGLGAVAMLFTPASNRWFAHKGEEDPAVFE